VPPLAGLSRETVVTPINLKFEVRRFPARPFTLHSLPRQGQALNGVSSRLRFQPSSTTANCELERLEADPVRFADAAYCLVPSEGADLTAMALQTPEQTPEGPVPAHIPLPRNRLNRPVP
jgi:hypothetical protein